MLVLVFDLWWPLDDVDHVICADRTYVRTCGPQKNRRVLRQHRAAHCITISLAATAHRSTLHHDFCRRSHQLRPRRSLSLATQPLLRLPPCPPPPPHTRIEEWWWGNACVRHCYIFIFLNPEDIPPRGKISKTLCKTTENAWGNAIPHGVSVEMQFPMG